MNGAPLVVLATFAVALGGVYFAAALILAAGLLLARRPAHLPTSALPRVSIVVPARNEELDLPACLAALERLEYPPDRLEILLVDDASTDGTAGILAGAAARLPHVRVLSTAGMHTALRAKARPLALGATHATGEWIFIADADAVVPPRWIRAMLAYAAPDVGLLGGPFVARGRSLAGRIEEAVEAYLMGVPFGVASFGGPPVASGPNMAIRRDIYVSQGGLEAVKLDIAEDMALLKLTQRAGARCAGGAEPDTTVRVAPVGTVFGVLRQQKRWIIGGVLDAPPGIKFLVVLIAACAWLASALTLSAWAFDLHAWILLGTLRFAGDALIATTLAARVGIRGFWRSLVLLEVYLIVGFFLLVPWCIAVPQVRWHGTGYEERVA